MTISRRVGALIASVLCGLLAFAGASVAAPGVAVGPGRVVFSVNGGAVADNDNGGGATMGVALPDGGAVLVGDAIGPGEGAFYAAQLTAAGALDPTFAGGGIARVATGLGSFQPTSIVRQADGKLIVAGDGPEAKFELPPTVLVRLNSDGSLDQTFGTGGVDQLAVQAGGGLALLPDGGIVVSGTVGRESPEIAGDPLAIPETQWVVAVLSPSGRVDPSFGQAGIATLPEAAAGGAQVATLPDGEIVALGQAEPTAGHYASYLTRLTAGGAIDPTFAGGTPITLVAAPNSMVADPDGTVVLGLRGSVIRYTAAGALDPGFGSGGLVPIASSGLMQLLPAPDDGVLVILQGESPADYGQVMAGRLTGDGALDPTFGGPTGRSLTIPFGGGGSGFVVSVRPRPLVPLAQNSFRDGFFLARPDGSYLSVGGVDVVQGTGEGEGRSLFDFAAAALTPSFAPDTTFGGPASQLYVKLRVIRQRASTDHARHGVLVELTQDQPGLTRVVIRAHGRVVAQNVLPAFAHGEMTLPVELTTYGNQLLRNHHAIKVTATATGRDLLTNTATSTAYGTLR